MEMGTVEVPITSLLGPYDKVVPDITAVLPAGITASATIIRDGDEKRV